MPVPRRQRILLLGLAAALAAVVAAGCGKQKTPLESSLSYVPKGAPVVAVFDTDFSSGQYRNIDSIGSKFPGWDSLKQQLTTALASGEVDFKHDIQPWLGNEAVLAAPSMTALGTNQILIAVTAKDQDKLDSFVNGQKKSGSLKQQDDYKDAAIYESPSGGTAVAVNGDELVIADDPAQLKSAIDTSGGDNSFSKDTLDQAFEGLPQDAVEHTYLNLPALIKASAGSAQAQKVPFVKALGPLGSSFSINPSDIETAYRVQTDKVKLSKDQLPFAAGGVQAELRGPDNAYGALGIVNLAHTITFAQDTAKQLAPAGFSEFALGKTAIAARTGVDLDEDVIAQLDGDTVITASKGGIGARIELSDPTAMAAALKQLRSLIPDLLRGGGFDSGRVASSTRDGVTIYAVTDGSTTVTYGVVGDVLVIAGRGVDLGALADSPKTFPSVSGAVSSVFDPTALFGELIATGQLPPQLLPYVAPLGNVTGSIEETTTELTGKFKVEFR